MRIKILFRILLLFLIISVIFDILDDTPIESAFVDEMDKLTMTAIDEVMVFINISMWFIMTICSLLFLSWIGLFFFYKWARQLYSFSLILMTVVYVPAFLEDPTTQNIELLSLIPFFFVLILCYIKPIKLLFSKELDINSNSTAIKPKYDSKNPEVREDKIS